MRTAVRAIIIDNDKLLVMHRNKFGKEYHTLLGGNVEIGENPEEALAREVYEESQLQVHNLRLVFIEHCELPYGDQLIFLCDFSGDKDVKLWHDSEEAKLFKMGKNLHKPMWMPIRELENSSFVTKELKNKLLDALKDKWPETPVEFNSKIL